MQDKVLNNFRFRAHSMGYKDIHIKRLKEKDKYDNCLYLVSAIEPLSGMEVRAVYTYYDFPRLCWYGKKSQRAFGQQDVD